MLEKIKIDFDKTVKRSNLTNKKIELRKKNLESFIKKGFQTEELKNGNFLT